MPSFEAEIDAHFYELIHTLVKVDPAEAESGDGDPLPATSDRRARPRESFTSPHKVAPYDGLTTPRPEDFVDVHCHDLARGGFSYLSPLAVESTKLITAFGVPPDVTCVEARVVRTTEVLQFPSTGLLETIDDSNGPVQYRGPNGEIGVPLFLISCRFVRRLKDAEEVSWK